MTPDFTQPPIHVSDKPIAFGPRELIGHQGDELELFCDVRGLPIPRETEIIWMFRLTSLSPMGHRRKDSEEAYYVIIPLQRTQSSSKINRRLLKKFGSSNWKVINRQVPMGWISTLRIPVFTAAHEGMYNCSTRNEFGTDWHSIMVRQQLGGSTNGFDGSYGCSC